MNVFANGKRVAILYDQESGSDLPRNEDYINLYTGNSQKVLLNVIPEVGLGGISNDIGPLDLIYLQDRTSTFLGFLATPQIDWTWDLQYVAFSTLGDDSTYILHVVNTDTSDDETINLPGVPAIFHGQRGYVGDIKISPDATGVAVAMEYFGVDGVHADAGTLYIVTLSDRRIVTYGQDVSNSIQIDGWHGNNNVDWSSR